ncbi:MAG: von Willebrand factor type A domain-containing protein [Phycisphaerales bacterium]|nr:MAG: von Willebrand factor type A domain-containing protein [Phycisphaerales bacterium]
MSIDPNDPKLTAYALGELDDTERAEVEAQLKESEAARQTVNEIRETAALLTRELKAEPAPALSDDQRKAIESRAKQVYGGDMKSAPAKRLTLRRWWIPTSVAASLLIVVGIGYMLLPSLEAARRQSRGGPADALHRSLANASRVRGIGTSARVYMSDDPSGWGIPVHPQQYMTAADMKKFASLGYVEGTVTEAFDSGEAYDFSLTVMDSGEVWAHEHFVSGPGCNTEDYDYIVENPFLAVTHNPLSTFSIDVDTASYANIRRLLNQGTLPPPGAVRIEEMVNYFDYDYPLPTGDDPFSVNVEVADCPWKTDHILARIGIKGQEFEPDERPPANLVFLIDVSGSMRPANKLPLLKEAMEMLVDQLAYDDAVAIAVYAGASGLVLPSTPCEDKRAILSALDRLQSGGSTNGGAGIQLAYDTAVDNFIEGGVNRVILATDGDFNVGTTSRSELVRMIEEKAKSGVFLSVLGFGMGNYKDSMLEKLADKGNGNYACIDTANEARKVLVEQVGGTLVTIAKDVKIQIEFNPAEVNAYRLIGYENRMLRAEDFNDDTRDAGEIGAGHTVTAFYEIVPAGVEIDLPEVDPLKYQPAAAETPSVEESPRGLPTSRDSIPPAAQSGELMTVKLRYKEPDGDTSKLIEMPVIDGGLTLSDMSDDFVFAGSVASFGMLLRGSEHSGDFTYQAVLEMAQASIGEDSFGYRTEFVNLVKRAMELQPE